MNLTSFSTFQPRDAGRFVKIVGNAMAEAIPSWADRVLETALELVPVATGELKSSGHVVITATEKSVAAAVVFDSEHSVFVEFGTGRRGAESAGAGDGPYDPNWPGMVAQPYLRPAYDQHRNEAVQMTREVVTAALSSGS